MVDYRKERGRPRADEPTYPTIPETVRAPEETHTLIRKIAKALHTTKHAAYRQAIDDYVEKYKHLAEGIELDHDE